MTPAPITPEEFRALTVFLRLRAEHYGLDWHLLGVQLPMAEAAWAGVYGQGLDEMHARVARVCGLNEDMRGIAEECYRIGREVSRAAARAASCDRVLPGCPPRVD